MVQNASALPAVIQESMQQLEQNQHGRLETPTCRFLHGKNPHAVMLYTINLWITPQKIVEELREVNNEMHSSELQHQADILALRHRNSVLMEQDEWQQMEILLLSQEGWTRISDCQ